MGDTEALNSVLSLLHIRDKAVISTDHSGAMRMLVAYIDHLIDNDFNKLINILYRLDISEEKIRRLLSAQEKSHSSETTGHLIAGLLIDREAEKIKTRAAYKKRKSS